MQYELQVFEFEIGSQFRVVDRNGEPWFVLADVCRVLEIANPSDAASRLDDDEKATLGIAEVRGAQRRTMTIINESGLYSIILTSRKPEAKRFRKWVTSEVLPSIRKTGSYGVRGGIPRFVQRYNMNWDRTDPGYWSVINELMVHLYGRFEMAGYILRDKAPDGTENRIEVAVGKRFSSWLKANHPELERQFSYYMHQTPEWEGSARQYVNELLPKFRDFIDTEWLPKYAEDYFKMRDPRAITFMPKLLPTGSRRGIGQHSVA